ncbi:MAG: cytochrome c biogenesis protein CcsA [Cocleimonas sp.]
MTSNLLNLTAIAFYIITWVLITRSVQASIRTPDTTEEKKAGTSKVYFITWGIALSDHLFSIITPLTNSEELSLSFVSLGSYVMWFISLILFISTLSRKIQALAVVILPFTVLSIIFLMLSNGSTDNTIKINSGLGIHILVSLLAYSTLMLAAIQAILLATQNNFLHKRLKNPQQSNFFRTLPALEDMEYFLFNLIGVGVILLSIGLLSGFYYLDNLFGSSVAHKTILSILSWIIFSALLLGRWKYGWRGKTAVRWTISGFAVLALSFFGSKFIQEFVIEEEVSTIYQEQHLNMLKKTPPTFLPVSNHEQASKSSTT